MSNRDDIKVIPGPVLKVICAMERYHGFNRQHPKGFESAIDENVYYPVSFAMEHEHINGEYVGDTLPHYRTMVVMGGGQMQFDITKDVFESLPTVADIVGFAVPDDEGVEG